MQNQLEVSQYLEWYVLSDPGSISLEAGAVTGQPLVWFRPKFGLDAGNELCIAAGSPEELEKFKKTLDKKREGLRETEAHKAYVKIETILAQEDKGKVSDELIPYKAFVSEYQKDRIVKVRKR